MGPGGEFRTLAIVEPDLPDNRLNEGRVGPDGAFWVGTMQNNLEPDGAPKAMTRDSGAIYRIDGNGRVSQLNSARIRVDYQLSEASKSDVYRDALPLLPRSHCQA